MGYGSENLIIKQKLEDAIEYSYCVFRHFSKAERFTLDMPNDTTQHQRLIALSGFGAEILFAPLLYLAGLWLYPLVVAAHLCAYPFYAGDYNDFRWGK